MPAPDRSANWFVRHPLVTYLVLAFGISWVGVIAIVGLDGFPVASDAEFRRLIAPLVAVMLLGPSVAGVLAVWLDGEREGKRDGLRGGGRAALAGLVARAKAWQEEPRWYAVALLTAPVVILVSLLVLWLRDPWYRPGLIAAERPVIHLLLGLLTGVVAGLFEEIGWTGYVTPVLRRRFTPTMTGLVLGVIWGLWHLVASFWGSNGAGEVPLAIYLPVILFSTLIPYRVAMTFVHERTQSLFVAMVMHGALTASLRILEPLGIGGWRLMVFSAMTSGLFCLVAVSFAAWRSNASSPPRPAPSSRASSMAPGAS